MFSKTHSISPLKNFTCVVISLCDSVITSGEVNDMIYWKCSKIKLNILVWAIPVHVQNNSHRVIFSNELTEIN